MRDLYRKVSEILNRVDFERIWPGFSSYPFALYDQSNVYFHDAVLPHDNRFTGNTSINYEGVRIAIWNVEDPRREDPEILAANMAHEMFHAYQSEVHTAQGGDDLIILGYPDHRENYEVKYREQLLLAGAFEAEDMGAKADLLKRFMSARRYRETLIGDMIEQEYHVETIEGTAEYAGTMALLQISRAKYQERVNGHLENLRAIDPRFFHIRRMLYSSGTVLCLLLRELGVDFAHVVGGDARPLFSIVAANAAIERPLIGFDESTLSAQVDRHLAQKRRMLEDFLATHRKEVPGDFTLRGFDPMNMIKVDDLFLCTHFIMLKAEGTDEPLFLKGPVAVRMKPGTRNAVSGYMM